MDNPWQPSKCGSTCLSSAEPAVVVAPSPVSQVESHESSRNSMINPSHYYYAHVMQEPCSSTRKIVADPLFQATNINLYNSSLSGIGTSFFTLLSGLPASFSKYDSQHVLSSKPSHPSSKVHVYNSSPIAGPTECEASFGSPKISSQHFDNLYLKSKIDACPVVPVRTLASDGVNTASCLHDIVQARKVSDPSLKLAKAANYHTSHGIEQLNGFSSLKAAPTCGVTPVKSRELHSSSTPHQLSPLACGLPRVFCLYASGDLSLSSSGLLGVVCSCHGFHMSISKFSEHSGLQDVNPGDAVHTDSGETIAQWRKVYYSKFGIRIPEDQHGWHWPEGFTTAADLVKSSKRVPNVSKSSDLSKSFGPPRPFIPSKQPSNNMVFRNKHHSSQNMVNEIPCHEPEKNTHDNHELPNGFVHGGAANKIMEQLSNAFQSNPTYIDPIYKTKKPFTSQNHIQNLRSHGKDSDKFNNSRDGDVRERATVSSNIELRLGQPSQQGQTLGKSNPPGFPTPRFSRVAHPLELISSQPTLHNAGSNRITEENKQFVDCAAQAAKISSTEGQNQLRFSNLGFAAYSSRTTHQPEQLKGDIVPGSVNSMLFSHLGNPKDKMQTKNSHLAFNHPKMIFSTDWAKHVDHGFSTPVSSGPRPPLLAGTSPRVFSSVGMNSSPNMTSTMSKEEATRVINPHTSSMRQGVRYLNQADVSSSCGFSKDQIVPGNSLKENVRSSITLPSKLKGRRDEYKLASQQSLPEHYGTTSWTAGGAEKSAMISGTSCAYIPDNCSCWVQRNTMIENSNLDGKNSVGAFGEPLEKGCIKIGETMKPNLKKVEFNAFQWKDVPSKDQKTKFLEGMIDVNEQTSGEKPVCMKEQVMSNISSKCSAPALTQASVKISNGDSCTDDAQNTGCAKNFAVDEGSGIQKSCSSDDALESGGNTGFNGFGCKTNLKNGTRSRVVPDRSTRSLIDELRVIDSLRLKKVQNQVHTGLPMTSSMKEFEPGKRKREMKFKVHATSFPVSSVSTESSGQSSQSLEDVHKLDKSTKELPCKTPKRVYEDFLEAPESSRGKKARLDLDFSKWKQKRITRPVVCGKYGLISNGDTSKPAKIFSLRKILKTAKRWDPDPPGNKVVKKPPEKVWATPITREGNRRSGRISNLKEDECQIGQKAVVVSDDDSMETSDSSYMLKKVSDSRNEISHGIPDNELGTRTWRKSKEVRIRSLHDLITKGKDSGVATMSKDIASVPQDNPNHGNSNNLTYKSTPDVDTFCHVCSGLNNDEMNCLLECNRCLIKVHQACYGISKVPKSQWFCRPCRENTTNMVCVLCGYEGGVMTRAVHTSNIVKTLLDAWKESQKNPIMVVLNSVTAGVFDPTVKQWVHMVCGLWTPGTRCPNVDTMSAFDVSGASNPDGNMVCSMCKRGGGCCIRCRVVDCSIHFHPWCAHQKGLLQSEVEGADNENVGFYGRCELHATKDHFKHKTNSLTSIQVVGPDEKETCARTEGYKGRKREGYRHDSRQNSLVRQEQVDAWNFINQLSLRKHLQRTTTTNTTTTQPVQDVEYDPRKEYARYKQSKGWKHLVVYKSGIHALGLYTSLFISQSEMVVEYVGEIVGLRVADRREIEYQSGKQLQYKSACYFFRIDKEHIIDATRKGGIARFVNHSCQPNCVAKVITVRGEKKVVFFAERDIYPGEEITYDYHFNNEDEGKKILCSCNSNNCRRYLN